MARAIAGATISFGLVSIPVKLYSATQASAGVSFNLLHEKCGTRLKQQYICPTDGEIVPREDMIKGYEFAKDQYVTFTADELKALEEKATQTIEISEFIPLAAIDPVFFDKPYYLGPEKGGDKAYTLLAEAMRETGRAALARYAARGKQYLVMLRPYRAGADKAGGPVGGGIVMQQLLYADEVRPFSDVPLPDSNVREPELKLAKQLIDQIAAETFDPTQYSDDVRKRIHEDIERKMQGQDIAASPAPAEPARIIDLMEALKASLGNKGKGKEGSADSDEPADDERKGARHAGARAEKPEPKRARSKR